MRRSSRHEIIRGGLDSVAGRLWRTESAGDRAVSGRVTYQGKPVPLGQIVFYPEKGRPATGSIGSDGSYRLTTFVTGDGAMLGRYRVTIEAMRTTRGGARPKTLEDELHGVGQGSGQAVMEWLVPEKYSRQETTPLTVEVKSGQNTINLDLSGP